MIACGSSGAISPGNAAANTTTSRISAPAVALRLPTTARRKRFGAALARSDAEPVASVSRLPRSRIEHGSREVCEQDADQHGERVEQEEPLHQGQIVIGAGRVEEVAEPGIREQ